MKSTAQNDDLARWTGSGGQVTLERAYNARSTRPTWHWWKPADGNGRQRALCGATCMDFLLDNNVSHVHGCFKCDEKQRKLATGEGK